MRTIAKCFGPAMVLGMVFAGNGQAQNWYHEGDNEAEVKALADRQTAECRQIWNTLAPTMTPLPSGDVEPHDLNEYGVQLAGKYRDDCRGFHLQYVAPAIQQAWLAQQQQEQNNQNDLAAAAMALGMLGNMAPNTARGGVSGLGGIANPNAGPCGPGRSYLDCMQQQEYNSLRQLSPGAASQMNRDYGNVLRHR
jgi:hypothetical protein